MTVSGAKYIKGLWEKFSKIYDFVFVEFTVYSRFKRES